MISVKQTFKLYDVVNRYFRNEEDSRTLVTEMEEIMDNKVDLKMSDFATKKDMNELRMELKLDIANLTIRMEQGFKDQLKWTILLMISFASIIVTVIKFL